jgi:hypothetical protein
MNRETNDFIIMTSLIMQHATADLLPGIHKLIYRIKCGNPDLKWALSE